MTYFILEHSSIQLCFTLCFILQQLSSTLKLNPTTFEELKTVLTAISDIRNMAVDVEMKLYDIQERYRTLAMYKFEVLGVQLHVLDIRHLLHFFFNSCVLFLFKVGQDELELKAKIGQIWENLFKEARQVDLSLADVKKSFSVVRYQALTDNDP